MTKFESSVKKISAPRETVFGVLSDLRNIESHLEQLPPDQIKVERIEEDAIYFKVEMAGEIGLKIIEKTPFDTIKFESQNSPIVFNLWIQLKEVEPDDVRMKLTIKAELNPMIKMVVSKHIQSFLDKLADGIAAYKY